MSVESYSDAEAGHLFEELFLHFKKDYIEEQEMLDFLKSKGLEIKDRQQLEILMYKAERAMGWITAGVGCDWKSAVFAKSPEDLERFLTKHRKMKRGK